MWIHYLMPGCAAAVAVMWLILGRDKKTIPVISVRPPQGLDPLEMEYAQIANISDRGIFAMILYWGSKGLVETCEEGGSCGESSSGRIGFRRIAELPDDAPDHAGFLFQGLFQKREVFWLDKFPKEISEHKQELRDLVKKRFTGKNAVVENDNMYATLAAMFILLIGIFVIEVTINVNAWIVVLLGVLLFTALALLQNGALGLRSKHERFELLCGSIGTAGLLTVHLVLLWIYTGEVLFAAVFAVSFLICVPCIMFMERRVNHKLYGRILGFRRFIETAEWDRLKTMSEEDPDFGMDILPYAMLFNMGTAWTARFENKTICTAVETMDEMAENNKK